MIDLTATEIDELLREQVVGRIGCHVDGLTYVVPVIFAYAGDSVYVASIEGQKTEMMRRNPNVCFEVDVYGPEGWRSAIAQGTYEELTDPEDVERALDLLAARFGRSEAESNRRLVSDTTVCFRIAIRDVSGRAVRR